MGNNLKKKLAADQHNMELECRKAEERLHKEQHLARVAEHKTRSGRVSVAQPPLAMPYGGARKTAIITSAMILAGLGSLS